MIEFESEKDLKRYVNELLVEMEKNNTMKYKIVVNESRENGELIDFSARVENSSVLGIDF